MSSFIRRSLPALQFDQERRGYFVSESDFLFYSFLQRPHVPIKEDDAATNIPQEPDRAGAFEADPALRGRLDGRFIADSALYAATARLAMHKRDRT